MRWLLVVLFLVVAAFAIPLVMSDVRRMGRRPALRSLVIAAVWILVLAVGLRIVHGLGWFSVVFVGLLFIPLGLAGRFALLATRKRRDRLAQPPAGAASVRHRVVDMLAPPALLLFGLVAAAIGLAVAEIVSAR